MVRPAPSPVYVFRPSHQDSLAPRPQAKSVPRRAINHIAFVARPRVDRQSALSLLTADNLGWLSLWDLESKRVQVLWNPHPESLISGGCLWAESTQYWPHDRPQPTDPHPRPTLSEPDQPLYIISQGREHRFVLSRLEPKPASTLARAVVRPTTDSPSAEAKLVAECPTNVTTFCKARILPLPPRPGTAPTSVSPSHDAIVAAPSSKDEALVDLFGVQTAASQIIRIHGGVGRLPTSSPTGSVMTLSLFAPPGTPDLIFLLVGYEAGTVALFNETVDRVGEPQSTWQMVGSWNAHTEPVFSLACGINPTDPRGTVAWSVGADRNIVRYEFVAEPGSGQSSSRLLGRAGPASADSKYVVRASFTTHTTSDQMRFDVHVRSDGKVVAMYGWGGKLWLFDTRLTEEPVSGSALKPLGLLDVRTSDDTRNGVLAFAPLTASTLPLGDASRSRSALCYPGDLAGLALLVASGSGASVTAWEVFPPSMQSGRLE